MSITPIDRVNLRCPAFQTIRKPIISPLIPDYLVVICEECFRRKIFEPPEPPIAPDTLTGRIIMPWIYGV